jgi:hypothetical protein
MVDEYKIFKEGDRVYINSLGWGTITEIGFYIVINFDSINDTRYIGGGLVHLISFTEYTLEGFSQERPEELPKPGDIVWVKDKEYDNWRITYFRKQGSVENFKYGTNPKNSGDSHEIIYYKYLTTKNPYANEHN